MTPAYTIFCVFTLASVFILFLSEADVSRGLLNPQNCFIYIINALINTIRVFGIDESLSTWLKELQPSIVDSDVSMAIAANWHLSLYISILCVSAPIITFLAFCKLIRVKFAVLALKCHPFSKAYIFTEMNERSVNLANSIVMQTNSTSKSDVFKPLIIFTDVVNAKEEQSGELYERIRYMRPVITHISAEAFARVSHRFAETYIFCISGDEFKNAGRAITMRVCSSFLKKRKKDLRRKKNRAVTKRNHIYSFCVSDT